MTAAAGGREGSGIVPLSLPVLGGPDQAHLQIWCALPEMRLFSVSLYYFFLVPSRCR